MKNLLIWTGGLALLLVALIDTLAVIGRHVGFPLLGSIELIQPGVLVAGAAAILFATIMDSHARVRLLYDRLSPAGRQIADILSELSMLVFLGAVLAGSVWLSLDLWNAHEISEIVGVPWRWLRLVANLALAATLAVSARQLFKFGQHS